LVAAQLLACSPRAEQPPQAPKEEQVIKRAQLEEMFAGMRAKAPWNVDGPLLWGYFFNGQDRSSLERVAEAVKSDGYRVVALEQREGLWRLHVEKVETHSVDSLERRNGNFYALAHKVGGVIYDGMDVGPAS